MWMAFILPVFIFMIGYFLSWGYNNIRKDNDKLSVYECGFTPFMMPRSSFSIYFFLISIVFLVFDMEIVLLLPLPFFFCLSNVCLVSIHLFIILLIFGLYHEWREGSLFWTGMN